MKKAELARRIARQSGLSKAQAADQLDRVVHQIISNLRKGQTAPLPGLGRFTPGKKGGFQFEQDKAQEKPGRAGK